MANKVITISVTEQQLAALDHICAEKSMSRSALVKQGLNMVIGVYGYGTDEKTLHNVGDKRNPLR